MRSLLGGALVLLLLIPQAVSAATFFGPIVPKECHTCPCGFAGVLEIARHLMNFAVTFGVIVLTIMIAWGGFLYILSAVNPESRSKANSLITGAVIGIVLVLTSWLIIDFVMRTLYSGADGAGGKFGPWNSILAEEASWCIAARETSPLFDSLPFSPGTGPQVVPTNPDPNENPVQSSQALSEANARQKLAAAGISVNKAACSTSTATNCTNVGGVQQNVIDQVIAIKKDCNCTIIVTGGSEAGHAGGSYSHGAGYKIDIGLNSAVNTYLGGLIRADYRGSDPRYLDRCGNEYVRESNHWDITVNRGVCNPPRSI